MSQNDTEKVHSIRFNHIYNLNCSDGFKLLEDESVDLIITSPPYDNLRSYQGYSFDFESVAKEMLRVLKDGGIAVWVVGDATVNGSETGTSFKQALYFKDVGFNLHDTMIYAKDSLSFPDINRYYQCFEYMFVLSKGKPKTINLIQDRQNLWADGKKKIKGRHREKDGILIDKRKGNLLQPYGTRFNIWKYSTGKNKSTLDQIAFEHPAIFPEKLAQDHIISWSNENDVVLDPFMGSGTTAKMCLLLNRKFIGFEISQDYCDIAKKRIDYLLRQTTIFTDFEEQV